MAKDKVTLIWLLDPNPKRRDKVFALTRKTYLVYQETVFKRWTDNEYVQHLGPVPGVTTDYEVIT